MVFNLAVVLVVVGLGTIWTLVSPLLRAIVLDTLRHPNRAAAFEVRDGVVTVTPKGHGPKDRSNGSVSYVESAAATIWLREASVVPANWPRLLVIASSAPQRAVRDLQPVR